MRLEITDSDAAAVLTDWRQRRFLEPFMRDARSMSAAARELGAKLNAMHYQVGRLLELGLLAEVGTRKRKGRPIRLYRASATEFFVPFDRTPYPSLEAMLRRLSALEEFPVHVATVLTSDTRRWGVLVSPELGDAGGVSVKLAPVGREGDPQPRSLAALLAPDAPAVWAQESVLELDVATAKQFQREMADLLERYEAQQRNGERQHFVVLGLTPVR